MIFTIVLCFTVQSGLRMCKNIIFSKICLLFEARRKRKMTFQEAKPSRILHFCINFFIISRQRKNLINGRSGSEIGHPKAPWGPHFTFLRWPLGELIFVIKFFFASKLLTPSWSPLGTLLRAFRSLLAALLGALLGASWRPLKVSLKLHRVLTTKFHLKNLRSFTSWPSCQWPSCQHLLHFLP